jgi:protein phosphatase
LLLKYFFPNSVYIIRGNHEFLPICSKYGFQSENDTLYPDESIFELFIDLFNYLPLASILQNNIFCVHGGICSELETPNQIKLIHRPLPNFNDSLVEGLVWNDSFLGVEKFTKSSRNSGYLFGRKHVIKFLQENSLKMIIRARESAQNGIQFMFSKHLVTVFSASNYCGNKFNWGGVLRLQENGEIQTQQFEPLIYLRRSNVTFTNNILSDHLLSKILPNCHDITSKKNNFPSQIISQNHNARHHFPNQSFAHHLISKR